MKIRKITDPEFRVYGRVVEGYDFSEVIDFLSEMPIPGPVAYVASCPELEALPVFAEFEKGFYGGLGAELGYCMGHNDSLNGLEYHRGSEVNVAVTDHVVLIGKLQDVEDGMRYNTENVEAFYVTAGTAYEFYATTLHYCACHVNEEGYAHATFLPKYTNTPISPDFEPRSDEDRCLMARNKWLIAHPDGGQDPKVPTGLYGPNWTMADIEM